MRGWSCNIFISSVYIPYYGHEIKYWDILEKVKKCIGENSSEHDMVIVMGDWTVSLENGKW